MRRLFKLTLLGTGAALAVLGLACAFRFRNPAEGLLLAVASGFFGGGLASVRPGWRLSRAIDSACRGVGPALAIYYVVRGLLLRSDVAAVELRSCGLVSLCLLIALGRAPRDGQPSVVNVVARLAVGAAIVLLTARGALLLLWIR